MTVNGTVNGLPVESLLDAPLVLDVGVKHVNFFNGRLLTASDLRAEQTADRQGRLQLGRVVGAGVAHGFEVTLVADGSDGNAPVLAVTGGLAVNQTGQAVELSISQVHVRLARQVPVLPVNVGLFQDCQLGPSGPDTTGRRAYVLTVVPASQFREQAPMVPVGGNGTATGCGDRYAVEGIAFRLVEVSAAALAGVSQETRDLLDTLMAEGDEQSLSASARRARLSRLRSILAHVCFGTEELAAFRRDPFRRAAGQSPFGTYGLIDRMSASNDLTDCDVPLALVYWSLTGVKFVDMWAARRRPVPRSPSSLWPLPVDERQRIEGEAIFQQFQDHLESILASGLSQSDLALIQARSYFRYLPPAGLLAVQRGARPGLVAEVFLAGLPHRTAQTPTLALVPEFVDDERLPGLVRTALSYPPIDLNDDELVWLYRPWQNDGAADLDPTVQPYVVFTSGHLPPANTSRFDVARWDDSNYAT
jgi:hypothetical protein